MELHILIDNLPAESTAELQAESATGKKLELHHEHGLSVYFTLDGKNWLVDTGASGKAFENMEKLRLCNPQICPVEEIDGVFISHGHNDHTGGLRKFLEENITAKIYLHSSIQGNYFFSCRPKNGIREARNIGIEQALFIDFPHRFTQLDRPYAISEKIIALPVCGEKKYPTPMGNQFLFQNDLPDNFYHEMALLVEYSQEKYAVISPCTHNGILNVLELCSKYLHNSKGLSGRENIGYLVGGLHFVDYLNIPGREDAAEKEAASIEETAICLKELYPGMKIISGHCTCCAAGEILKNILGENYSTFRTGTSLKIL